MGNLTVLGKKTRTIIQHSENHKLTLEIEAAVEIQKGQPVKLTAAGLVTPWAKADGQHTLLGVAVFYAEAGKMTTVWSRGYMIVLGTANAVQDAGPITYEGVQTTGSDDIKGYMKYGAAASVTDCIGWSLVQATAIGQVIRVVIKD